MFELTAEELVTIGIGSAVLFAGCLVEKWGPPWQVRHVGFFLGLVGLIIVILEMLTDHF